MGRSRLKYKSRPTVVTDDSELKKIKVELESSDKYDASNALVLPSQKRATKKLRDKSTGPVKLLSKKKRKHLEKIVDQKNKKEKDLMKLTQLQETQTLGRKRFKTEDYTALTNNEVEDEEGKVLSSVKGRKRKKPSKEEDKEQKDNNDLNVVRLGELSSSSDESDDEEEEQAKESDTEVIGELNGEQEQTKDTSPAAEADSSRSEPAETQSSKADAVEPVKQPAVFMNLNRLAEVQAARLKLPILAEEQVIMEAISENLVTVIVGATGSGKTTQIPQFLYETGYTSNGKMIGITEPRRVAAISMSQRVAHEMNLSSREVSYQIRFEGNSTSDTKIKFMTDGVLLKEIQLDPTLKKYSVIVIDEAHERSVFSDILIGILSRIIPRRQAKGKPLKLIIMSATLKVEDFTENVRLFKEPKPPVIKVDARMFDVTIHYNKRTAEDYLGEAYKKACKIHRQLPEGGILIFLTGQQEVNTLVRKLRATFPVHSSSKDEMRKEVSGFRKKKLEIKAKRKADKESPVKKIVLPEVKLENFSSALPDDAEGDFAEDVADLEDRGAVDHGDSDLDLDEEEYDIIAGKKRFGEQGEPEQPLWVLPLFSMLPPEKQQMVFRPPPEGTRLCVVATNVAETSLTIPSIKYVVDCGKVKEKVYDKVTGVSMFHVTWTSQASANQRAGRAGRTAPGHCYRLYSSAIFNDEFLKFSRAEIQRRPIDDLVLVMKAMNLPVVNFPFPTPPEYLQICHGIKRLLTLGALEELPDPAAGSLPKYKKIKTQKAKDLSRITSLGKAMAAFPLAPRYGKMLALSHQHSLLPYTVALVAALTVPEVLIETPLDLKENVNDVRKRWRTLRMSWAGTGNSRRLGDVMVLLRAVGAAEYEGGARDWCENNGLRHKGITEIRKLRRQLTNEINLIIPSCDLILDPHMAPPTDDQARLLRQIVLAGSVDHVARRVDDCELKTPEDKVKWRHAYRTQEMEEPVFMPTSSIGRIDMPQWVVYQDVYETHKMFMRNVTVIEPEWLAVFAPNLCTFSPPLESPEPRYDADRDKIVCHRTAKFGPASWEIPEVEVEYPYGRDLFNWVAYCFLIGHMCSPLKNIVGHLYEPRTLVNPVAIRYREQRESLLRALMSKDITNLAKLKEAWAADPNYLRREYLQWLQNKEVKGEVLKIWPPLDHSFDTNWS
ncbi:ATP-dependent RNA helicase kurz-like [Homarus americanus]|uniref:RNA helicase n=1 Tax=Homarus americanus TaxID=6706 RepID=A0A8J5K6F5_HOMAM|nr:ATP-dependent RNA helicase kurz-like [Homarus americanus]